jgi:cellulase/cellobiase CelA1
VCSPVGFNILRAPGTTGGTFTQVGTTNTLSPASFTNTGLTPGTTYRYQVVARDANGNVSSPSNTITVATPTVTCTLPPIAVGSLTATIQSGGLVALAWQGPVAASCGLAYEILRAPGASGGTFAVVGTTTGTTFTDGPLPLDSVVRYQVRGVLSGGGTIGTTNIVTVNLGPTTTTPPPGGCTVAYRVVNSWSGAFQGEITVRNTGTATINSWTVTLVFPSGVTITQMWGGTYSPASGTVTVRPMSYTATIAPNGTVTAGFLANASGSAGATPTTATCATA